jgi:hypothetical protein
MKTKEEYVEFVKEWKITHEALVKLQLHVKKYLVKSTYPNENFKLSKVELKKYLSRLNEVYNVHESQYHWAYPNDHKLELWTNSTSSANGYRWILGGNLREMYETRSFEKEQFKNSVMESVEV